MGKASLSKWSLFTSIHPVVIDLRNIISDWQSARNRYNDVKPYQAALDRAALIKLIGRGQYFSAKNANTMDPLTFQLCKALAKVDIEEINSIESALEAGKDGEVLVRFTRRRKK